MESSEPISQPAEFNPAPPRKRPKKKGLLFVIIAALLIAGGVFGYNQMQSGSSSQDVSPTPEMTLPTEEPTPAESVDESPTPDPEVTPEEEKKETPTPTDKPAATKSSELNIQVLNGSGEAGVGATGKEFLSGKGYEYIETGNADNYDYEGVTLKSKESVADYVTTLKSDLEEKYTISTESDTLSEDSIFDVVVIIGK